jgi:hypothetical protein
LIDDPQELAFEAQGEATSAAPTSREGAERPYCSISSTLRGTAPISTTAVRRSVRRTSVCSTNPQSKPFAEQHIADIGDALKNE